MPGFNTAIALSDFDGMHLGHINLIDSAKNYAHENGLKALAVNLVHDLSEDTERKFILTSEEKSALFKETCIETICYSVGESFIEFIKNILIDKYNCKAIFISEDFVFGKEKDINKKLSQFSDRLTVTVLPKLYVNNTPVDSGVIAHLIKEKNFSQAEKLMGRPYNVFGNVTSGKQLGRTIGFPTANLKAPDHKFLPSNGVYVTKTSFNGNCYNSITNVGVNPTVSGKAQSIETYIFDFSEDLYGKDITINFYKHIRDEKTFASVEELMNQISKDEAFAREYLKT